MDSDFAAPTQGRSESNLNTRLNEIMSNASFGSLIYRIIGKPERWHDDYIVDMMQQYLDDADANINNSSTRSDLAAGDQLLSQLQQGNVALNAFNTLLDKSRFKMIILDENFTPIYHNQAADGLLAYLRSPGAGGELKSDLNELISQAPAATNRNQNNSLTALDFFDEHGDQIYLRSITSQVKASGNPTLFNILMVLDKAKAATQLNSELVKRYELTKKEQSILLRLIHGDSIKKIAAATFTAESTVRSHIKSTFRKTDTNSQGALISLMLTHEAQILDSYFDSDITTASNGESAENDRELTLSSGQKIAYCDYGPKDGRPIIVFHSGFGSRLAIPPGYQEICARTNRRLIVPDRPGLGKTAFVANHPANWNQQLNEFIELLELDEYDVLGSIIACQMAVSFAAQADERLRRVILTSPVVLNEDSHAQYLTEILAPAARYVKLSPMFAKEVYELWLKSVTLNLDAHYPTILDASIGSAERKQFEEDGVIELLTNVFKEGARQSLDGILHEMVFCMTPLNLDLSKFTKPLDVWFGTEDRRITREGVDKIFDEFPNCTRHICEGYSEHLYYALLEKIIA